MAERVEAPRQVRFDAAMNRRQGPRQRRAGRPRQVGADRRLEILDVLRADVLEVQRQRRADIFIGRARQAHRSRRRQTLHAGGDVHGIAEEIAVPDHRLADMHADAEADAALFRHLVVHRADSLLDAERALQRIDGARELGQDAVAGGVGDAAAMLRDEAIRHLAMGAEQAKGAGLIAVHQAGVAGHVGADDGRETALDDGGRLVHRRAGPR